jgi:hypothetical protein
LPNEEEKQLLRDFSQHAEQAEQTHEGEQEAETRQEKQPPLDHPEALMMCLMGVPRIEIKVR